jgi:plasmid maintenance system antidote protein VapI
VRPAQAAGQRLIQDERPITVLMALLIGKALSTSPEILLDMQRDADLEQMRAELKDRLAKVVRLPITEKAA